MHHFLITQRKYQMHEKPYTHMNARPGNTVSPPILTSEQCFLAYSVCLSSCGCKQFFIQTKYAIKIDFASVCANKFIGTYSSYVMFAVANCYLSIQAWSILFLGKQLFYIFPELSFVALIFIFIICSIHFYWCEIYRHEMGSILFFYSNS